MMMGVRRRKVREMEVWLWGRVCRNVGKTQWLRDVAGSCLDRGIAFGGDLAMREMGDSEMERTVHQSMNGLPR